MQPNDPSNRADPGVPHDTPYGDCSNLPSLLDALYARQGEDSAWIGSLEAQVARAESERDHLRECAYILGTHLADANAVVLDDAERFRVEQEQKTEALFEVARLDRECKAKDATIRALEKELGALRFLVGEQRVALDGIADEFKPAKFRGKGGPTSASLITPEPSFDDDLPF